MGTKRGELALLIGGILLIVGTFLTFVTVDYGDGTNEGFNASDVEQAVNYLMAGGIAIVLAGILWVAKGATARKVLAVIGIITIGYLGVYAGFVDITSISDLGDSASAGLGLYVMTAGGVIAVVGAILAAKGGDETSAAAPPPPAA